MKTYVIGIDFGTDSARGILYHLTSLKVEKQVLAEFPRWKKGLYCKPENNQYRQHPLDYIEALAEIFNGLLSDLSKEERLQIKAIGTNTTGSTPVAVDAEVQPLALLEEFKDNPNAMFVLWKDHTALKESDEINQILKTYYPDYSLYSGGIYSSEWYWSKITHIIREDEAVLNASYSWLEQSDWVPNYLCGNTAIDSVKRNRCAAGHKAMWNEAHGGLPSPAFLLELEPKFERYQLPFYQETFTSDAVFGTIDPSIAEKYGLSKDLKITVGAIDAHHGAVGAGISPNILVKVMGTSTCDMLIAPKNMEEIIVDGICGQVDGSIIPDYIGYEAGQSAYGDVFQWFKQLQMKTMIDILGDTLNKEDLERMDERFFTILTEQASKLNPQADDLVFTDYLNGRRTPDANLALKSAAEGFSLSTEPAHIFKALVEATAFGSRSIIERFQAFNVNIAGVIAIGGIAEKSPYAVQVLADILQREINVLKSDQVCALGSVVFASTAIGAFESIATAQQKICPRIARIYKPNLKNKEVYETLYTRYLELAAV